MNAITNTMNAASAATARIDALESAIVAARSMTSIASRLAGVTFSGAPRASVEGRVYMVSVDHANDLQFAIAHAEDLIKELDKAFEALS